MIQRSVLLELEKQKAKLAMNQQKEKTNSNKVKLPVKRKSRFTNCSSRENDKKITKEKKQSMIALMIVKKISQENMKRGTESDMC